MEWKKNFLFIPETLDLSQYLMFYIWYAFSLKQRMFLYLFTSQI